MARLNKEREKRLEPTRLQYAKQEIKKLNLPVTFQDEKTLKFTFEGNVITFFAYSGWFSGKGIQRAAEAVQQAVKNFEDANSTFHFNQMKDSIEKIKLHRMFKEKPKKRNLVNKFNKNKHRKS